MVEEHDRTHSRASRRRDHAWNFGAPADGGAVQSNPS